MGAFRHSQTKVLLFRGLKMAVWGTRELRARLPLCLKEHGCRTLARETGGSSTAGEKDKKTVSGKKRVCSRSDVQNTPKATSSRSI